MKDFVHEHGRRQVDLEAHAAVEICPSPEIPPRYHAFEEDAYFLPNDVGDLLYPHQTPVDADNVNRKQKQHG